MTILIGKVDVAANAVFLSELTALLGGVNKAYHGAKLGKNDSWPRVYGRPSLFYHTSSCNHFCLG